MMTKPSLLASIAFTFLVIQGCANNVSKDRGPIHGSIDSGLDRVKVGMTADEVSSKLGAHQNEDFDASSGDTSCRSYVYDETIDAKYAHVSYLNGRVVRASEGHSGMCQFAPDVM